MVAERIIYEYGSCVFVYVVFFFFFQAEDGIRDIGVTGVQTCALPIWTPFQKPSCSGTSQGCHSGWARVSRTTRSRSPVSHRTRPVVARDRPAARTKEIGRASCRERV